MKVFKFGGASVKDANAVKNVGEVIKLHSDNLVIVISAMGFKTPSSSSGNPMRSGSSPRPTS